LRVAADVPWLHAQAGSFSVRGELRLTDASHNYSAVAVQGPRVSEFVDACIPGASHSAMRVAKVTDLKRNEVGGFTFGKTTVLVSRTGYTGEDGFEIVGREESIRQLWENILNIGRRFGVRACGLGARDTLRLEAGMPLHGHEIDETTNPFEAGLQFAVKLGKAEDFVGRARLDERLEHGPASQLARDDHLVKTTGPRDVHHATCLLGCLQDPAAGKAALGIVDRMIGISRNTLYRWLEHGALDGHEIRDWRGWRLFKPEDITALRKFANQIQEEG